MEDSTKLRTQLVEHKGSSGMTWPEIGNACGVSEQSLRNFNRGESLGAKSLAKLRAYLVGQKRETPSTRTAEDVIADVSAGLELALQVLCNPKMAIPQRAGTALKLIEAVHRDHGVQLQQVNKGVIV